MYSQAFLRVVCVCVRVCADACVFHLGLWDTCSSFFAILIKYNQVLASYPSPFLDAGAFLYFHMGYPQEVRAGDYLVALCLYSRGGHIFFDVLGFTVIYRLRLWPVPRPAGLLFSLADTSRCLEPVAPCLPSHYSSQPTFPFGTEHSVILTMCWICLLPLPPADL